MMKMTNELIDIKKMKVNPQIVITETGDLDNVHLDLTLLLDKDNNLIVIDNTEVDWKDYIDTKTQFVKHIKPEMS
jgi:ethanolamine utilization protein EutA (predicted chaperonin)